MNSEYIKPHRVSVVILAHSRLDRRIIGFQATLSYIAELYSQTVSEITSLNRSTTKNANYPDR